MAHCVWSAPAHGTHSGSPRWQVLPLRGVQGAHTRQRPKAASRLFASTTHAVFSILLASLGCASSSFFPGLDGQGKAPPLLSSVSSPLASVLHQSGAFPAGVSRSSQEETPGTRIWSSDLLKKVARSHSHLDLPPMSLQCHCGCSRLMWLWKEAVPTEMAKGSGDRPCLTFTRQKPA